MNHFEKNRKKVHQLFYDAKFISPLSDSDFEITEENKRAELKKVIINNTPFDEDYPISWKLNPEIKNQIFSAPDGVKQVDDVLILLINRRLHFYMFELKSNSFDLKHIKQKFIDTISRLSIFLPIYNFNQPSFNHVRIVYHGIVLFNQHGILDIDDEVRKTHLYKILKEGLTPKRILLTDYPLLENNKIEIDFIENPTLINDRTKFELEFNQIYSKAISNKDLTCPH